MPLFDFASVARLMDDTSSSLVRGILGRSHSHIKKTFYGINKPQLNELFIHNHQFISYSFYTHSSRNSRLDSATLSERSNFKICPQSLILSTILTTVFQAAFPLYYFLFLPPSTLSIIFFNIFDIFDLNFFIFEFLLIFTI